MVTMKRYEYHKFAELLPTTADDDYHRIREDIRTNGLKIPIVLYRGQILDGRTRYKACMELRIIPTFTEFDGTEQDALRHVASHNLYRRHLTQSQKAMVAIVLKRLFEAEGLSPAQARNQAAAMADVSIESARKAEFIDDNEPERISDIVNGRETVNKAEKAIRAKRNPFLDVLQRHNEASSATDRLHLAISRDLDSIATGADLRELLYACSDIKKRLSDAWKVIDRMMEKHSKENAKC